MKVAFLGTPRFGALVLGALLRSGHEVVLVITQPDRPAGRGRQLTVPAVKELALAEGLKVVQPESASTPETAALLESLGARAYTVASFGQILKPPLLGSLPGLNVHASLLPRYRGAAPIERAIMDGESETGVSIMDIVAELDAGGVYLQRSVTIEESDDAGSLYQKLGREGGEALVEALDRLEAGTITPEPQDEGAATYAEKITAAEREIDWTRPAQDIFNQVRGLSPNIGAFTAAGGQRLKVWKAALATGGGGEPGAVRLEGERLWVACGDGALELLVLQPGGGRRLGAAEFLRGHRRLLQGGRLGK